MKLKRHKLQTGLYVIVYEKETARLAFYHNMLLSQWYYKDNPPACIVGLANGREEACEMIEKIAGEALAAIGEASLIAYLSGKDPESFQE
ncbi:MAG: hypothetical protein NC415_00640 [bacterium]|nr:hypothetical protein [bacterium]